MNQEIQLNTDNVVQALSVLYSIPHPTAKITFPSHNHSDQFLTKYQQADPASVVLPISSAIISSRLFDSPSPQKLHDPIVFFAASSIKKGVVSSSLLMSTQRHINPPTTTNSFLSQLRDLILRCLSFPEETGFTPPQTQLALALSHLSIKMNWLTVVSDMINFVNASQISALVCVNFLGVLPSIVQSELDSVHNSRDYHMTVENFAMTVLDSTSRSGGAAISSVFTAFLSVYNAPTSPNPKTKHRVLSSFATWVQSLNR